ncbi:GH3 auxin-responsive promoter family protein [Schlesneria paludicola]|uniref:GH3 auxin-responsive promoter family protein n=1 Tax=Schlesneria paludicola TaxID=360056 RepID=UPI000299ECFF|nr:GH3 auxin-responsive promoter family protein [Schlesneria paludicola]
MLKVSRLVPRSVLRTTLSTARTFLCDPFVRRLERASRIQQDWLLKRIRACQTTTFGRDHHFQTIRTLSDFRKQVPVSEYARLAHYINAVAAGDTRALIPDQDRLIQFTITTGSTGVPKLNPVTRSWLREYRAGWEIWGTRLFTDHPDKIGSRVLQMSGTWDMGRTVGGHQISMVSALLTRTQSPLVKPFYAIPDVLNDIRDPVVRHYAALRLTILDDIGWIMLMNPGTLIRLAEIGDQYKERLIRDVFEGTLSKQFDIPEPIRASLKRFVPAADPRGAMSLEAIVNRTGRLMPSEYWKQPVISCWLGGTAGFPSRYLHELFGSSPLRDMGLVSSEGRHTIPLQDTEPYGVPSVGAGFYEFIPVDEQESETPTVLEGHELTVDRDYRIVITNSAGYYRFDIGDLVRCRGFIGQAPQLEFIQKFARVGDLEGEKLTEHQLVEGAHKAAAVVGVKLGLLTGVPRRIPEQKPYYDFLVTISEFPDSELAKGFLKELDLQLASLNFLWRARRTEGVLAAPRLLRLPAQGWDDYIQAELRRKGTGDYQYKHPGLVQHQDWLKNFSPVDTIVLD